MLNKFYNFYALLFAKPLFIKWNKFLYNISVRGLGILNYNNENLRGEYNWLSIYLKNFKEPFVVDIGANIGDYTNSILKISPNAKIISIEPHPLTFTKLKKNVFSKNVHLYNCAVGSHIGTLKLYDYTNNNGSEHASLYKDVIKDLHKGEVVSHNVQIQTLDSILDKKNCLIDLVKIDTEGNEFDVLLGAKNVISRTKAIHLEFNEMNIISKTTFKDFWDLLSNDFAFFRILPHGKLLPIDTYSTIYCEIYQYQNIICLSKTNKGFTGE